MPDMGLNAGAAQTLAFSILFNGADALTNIQAVMDGVSAFSDKVKNAQDIVTAMAEQTGKSFADIEVVLGKISQGMSVSGQMSFLAPFQEAIDNIRGNIPEVVSEMGNLGSGAEGVQQEYLKLLDVTSAYGVTTKQALSDVNDELMVSRLGMEELSGAGKNSLDTLGASAVKAGEDFQTLTNATNALKDGQLQEDASLRDEASTFTEVGGTTKQALGEINDDLMASRLGFEQLLGAGKNTFEEVGAQAVQAGGEFDGFTNSTTMAANAEEGATTATNDFSGALGLLSSVATAVQFALGLGVYQIVNDIINVFKTAATDGADFANSLYQVSAAAAAMQANGQNISFKDLQTSAQAIGDSYKVFSNQDVMKGLSTISFLVRDQGLSLQDLNGIMQITAASAADMNKSFADQARTVTSGLVNGYMSAGNMAGFAASRQDVLTMAISMGLAPANATISSLTEKAKILATLAVYEEHQQALVDSGIQKSQTQQGILEQESAKWKDFSTALGGVIQVIEAQLAPGFTSFLIWMKEYFLPGMENVLVTVIGYIGMLEAQAVVLPQLLSGKISPTQAADEIKGATQALKDQMTQEFSNAADQNQVNQAGQDLGNAYADGIKTATASQEAQVGAAVTKMDTAIMDQIQADQAAQAKLYQDYQNKLTDLQTTTNNKLADAETSYQNSVKSANEDYAAQRAAEKRKIAEEELKAEQSYQLQMQDLQNKYLFDLQGALQDRDAKKILQLQAQYEFTKSQDQAQFDLQEKQRQEDYALQIKNEAAAHSLKMKQLAEEEAAKERQIQVDAQRQQAADLLNYQRDQAALEAATQAKLQKVADGLISEYGFNAAGAQKIYELLLKYYGPGGMVDSIYAEMLKRIKQYVSDAMSILSGHSAGQMVGGNPAPSKNGAVNSGDSHKAGGGVDFASTPTSVTFGEAGPEMNLSVPLTQAPTGGVTVWGGGSGGNQQGGTMLVRIQLDDGLVGSIVNKSMNGVAAAVEKVRRGG